MDGWMDGWVRLELELELGDMGGGGVGFAVIEMRELE